MRQASQRGALPPGGLALNGVGPKPQVGLIPANHTTHQRSLLCGAKREHRKPRSQKSQRAVPACLLFKSPLPNSGHSRSQGECPASQPEGQCWQYVLFPLFWLPCLARGLSLQSHLLCTSSLLLSQELLSFLQQPVPVYLQQ